MSDAWTKLGRFPAESSRLDQILSEAGQRVGGGNNPAYLARLNEVSKFMQGVYAGTVDMHVFKETLTTSDFPYLLAGTLEREMIGRYAEAPATWQNYAKKGTVRDFSTVSRIALDGLEGRFYPTYLQPEMAPLTEGQPTESRVQFAVDVYSRAVSISWRLLVNDDLGAFRDLPDRLARGARRSEEYFAATLLADANGPHASVFTAGNANIITANPVLTIAGLATAYGVLGAQVDSDGEPIFIDVAELVVPPALYVTAQNIMNATEIRALTSGGADSAQGLVAQNWMKGRVRVSVNPYLPVVNTTSGNTAWYLLANPQSSRPIMEIAHLRGFEQPALFRKASDMERVGGGGVDPSLGDFETGEIRYKGMTVFGGAIISAKSGVASQGDGS